MPKSPAPPDASRLGGAPRPAAGGLRTRPPHRSRGQMPSLPALSKPSWLPPALPNPPSTTAPPPAPARSRPGRRGLVKQKEGSSSCLQPCPPPPTSAGHPAQPAPSLRGPGLSPRGQHRLRSPRSPTMSCVCVSPPPVHTHEQRSQPVVPGLGGSLRLPQPRRGSRGSAKGMLCPARKHGGTRGSREEPGDGWEHGSEICVTNTCISSHRFKPNEIRFY